MSRDKTIDRLRGFAMLWVIVVHVLYWGEFFTNESVNLLRSFCLFEMPLFFFITGASNSFSKIDSYFAFVSKRFQRILIPYWVFAIICALLTMGKLRAEGHLDFLTGILVFVSWMVPISRKVATVSYFTWALWFVPVYLCVVMLLPALKKMKASSRKIEFALLMVGLFVLTCLLKLGWIQHVAFYAFWTYVGLFYRDIKAATEQKQTRKYFLYSAVAGMAIMWMLCVAGQPLDMQFNKFPPNMIFFAFSVMIMGLIIFALPHLDRILGRMETGKVFGRIFNLFSNRSMTIFLYQVFAFDLTVRLSNMLVPTEGILASTAKTVLCLATTIPLCAGLAVIFGRIEKLEIRHYGRKVGIEVKQ